MEGGEEGLRLSKRINNGEVDYKTKSGTAWSHSYLNQKPWHPLSYPNQRRKWIAEQTHAQSQRRSEEVTREYAQEQEFFRQTALISKKEKEKIEMMKAVSFMYVRPPGYNAESAKAAEIADERRREEPLAERVSSANLPESTSTGGPSGEEKKKPRLKDVFGRSIPTEEEFEVLKNAPRLETGVAARAKPFGIEVRNVKCVRCGNFGHQSGDRECPLKDAIMPNEESRLKRDDPLTAIMAQIDPSEPLKWELKQKPGMSPPRGGFKPDDPNQQIVAEDIFDEYGGFLSGDIPELLTNFSPTKSRKKPKKRKYKKDSLPGTEFRTPVENGSFSYSDNEQRRLKKSRKKKSSREFRTPEENGSSPSDNEERKLKKSKKKKSSREFRTPEENGSSSPSDIKERRLRKGRKKSSGEFGTPEGNRLSSPSDNEGRRSKKLNHSESNSSDDLRYDRHPKRRRHKHSYSSDDSGYDRHHQRKKKRQTIPYSSEDSDVEERHGSKNSRRKHLSSRNSSSDRHGGIDKARKNYEHSSDDSDFDRHHRSKDPSHHCHRHRH